MRRKDREVSGRENLQAILDACKILRVGLVDEQGIYVVPVNYGYEYVDDNLVLYFHGAKAGRKAEALAKGDVTVGFEVDGDNGLVIDEEKHVYTINYYSIIGTGVVNVIDNIDEKMRVMGILMQQLAGHPVSFPEKIVAAANVYKITVTEYTGKRK